MGGSKDRRAELYAEGFGYQQEWGSENYRLSGVLYRETIKAIIAPVYIEAEERRVGYLGFVYLIDWNCK